MRLPGRAPRVPPPCDAPDREGIDNAHLRVLISLGLPSNANCVDIGANEGSVLAEIVRACPDGHHLAFEPLPELHATLADRFPSVDVRCAALSNRSGTVEFTHVRTLPSHSGFRPRDYPGPQTVEPITVEAAVLDDCLPAGYAPDFIKIDVEGAEEQVIGGGLATIRAHRPIVAFEHGIGAAPHYGTRPESIHAMLCDDARLLIFDLDGNGPYSRDQFTEAFNRGDRWNFVAKP